MNSKIWRINLRVKVLKEINNKSIQFNKLLIKRLYSNSALAALACLNTAGDAPIDKVLSF